MPEGGIFISYRRKGGDASARLLHDALTRRGYKVFLDVDKLRSGPFDFALRQEIEAATDVLVILTPGSLDRCWASDDWLRAEIVHALKHNKNVVPIFAGSFRWPKRKLPKELAPVKTRQGWTLGGDMFEERLDRLISDLLAGRPGTSPSSTEQPQQTERNAGSPKHRGIRLIFGFGKRRFEFLIGFAVFSLMLSLGLWMWSIGKDTPENRLAQQEASYRKILEHQEQLLGSNHSTLARTQLKLASVYQDQGKFDDAKALLERVLALHERTLGTTETGRIAVLEMLASRFESLDDRGTARMLQQRAAALKSSIIPPGSEIVGPQTNQIKFEDKWGPSEGFEVAWGDWSVDRGVWQVGVPSTSPRSKSNNFIAATILSGIYPTNSSSELISPSFLIPPDGAQLRFWHWFTLQPSNSTPEMWLLSASGGGYDAGGRGYWSSGSSSKSGLPAWAVWCLAVLLFVLSYLLLLCWPLQRRVLIYIIGKRRKQRLESWKRDMVFKFRHLKLADQTASDHTTEFAMCLHRTWWLRKYYTVEPRKGHCRVDLNGGNTPTGSRVCAGATVIFDEGGKLSLVMMNDSAWSGWLSQVLLFLAATILAIRMCYLL